MLESTEKRADLPAGTLPAWFDNLETRLITSLMTLDPVLFDHSATLHSECY